MKKILMIVFLVILVSCNTANLDVTQCTIELQEPTQIDRKINITSDDNEILNINTEDKFYFNEDFTKEMFNNLEADMILRHSESKNLEFKSEAFEEYATMLVTLNNIKDASATELMMVGITKEDDDLIPGLTETITINQKAGYQCKLLKE